LKKFRLLKKRLQQKWLPRQQSRRLAKNPRPGEPPNRYSEPRLLLKPGFSKTHATSPDC
jgi:hypothetical protein